MGIDVRSACMSVRQFLPMEGDDQFTDQRFTIIIDPFGTEYPRITLSSVALCGTPAVCALSVPDSNRVGEGGGTNRWVRRCSSAELRGRRR